MSAHTPAHDRARRAPTYYTKCPLTSPEFPERLATFSPWRRSQEIRGLAPTCSTNRPQSSPGPPGLPSTT